MNDIKYAILKYFTSILKNEKLLFEPTVIEDPYYAGLSARVPKFDRIIPLKKSNKNQNVIVPKRMSVAYLQHPMIFTPATGTPNNGYQVVRISQTYKTDLNIRLNYHYYSTAATTG